MPCCQGFLTQEHLRKAIPNYNNWLHPGDSSNVKMRLMVLYYSTVWTGTGCFDWRLPTDAPSNCCCAVSFLHWNFPLCFQERTKPLGNLTVLFLVSHTLCQRFQIKTPISIMEGPGVRKTSEQQQQIIRHLEKSNLKVIQALELQTDQFIIFPEVSSNV